ncbi:HD-GYP domain-containing protein [Dasania sp. GY-MA-18]|uniref:HD-GYP domain-containing protein n=1 Tax=Dasania phycosphaerae TaxID=2950436 RepID=A0A9J6RLU7_9GAMM|nr:MULTISPECIES: HD-GYP domain-containing protein [Dasania]MCR8922997.1 HD-GYP domain-containing protein [Dasania sp. GY-MA-18]MCZ0865428.1 HD-GYP domain-containing protein [Dasania phycosphaerae]MCZ0869153.1 HD-GYP domain-containing protein [Dasania phycosphaerae]
MSVRPSQIQRLNVADLKIGMSVVELDRPWLESPFTVHGFKIKTPRELKQLQTLCRYVYVINKKPKPVDPSGEQFVRHKYRNTLTFEHALPQAKSAHRQAKSIIKGFFNNMRAGRSFDATVAKKAVQQCVAAVIANQEAMIWLGLLKDVDEYTAEHSLNVAVYAITLGRAEGLSPADLETLGLCGLLHDIGKAKVPLGILNKEAALTDAEFILLKKHTSHGYEMLMSKHDVPEIAAEVAHSHHERINGRGYPQQLSGDKISYFSRIVAIADAYDAITSTRIYSPAKTALEGLRILLGAQGSHFDSKLVNKFINTLGIYPAGSVAELSTGEAALVLPTPQANNNKPRILIVRDRNKQPCAKRQLDLSQHPKDENGDIISIRHLLSNGSFGIDLAHYHDKITE